MKILLTVATVAEIEPFLGAINIGPNQSVVTDRNEIDILVTGVGMVATAYSLGKKLAGKKYDLAINAGIAGAFDRKVSIGDVLEVEEDTFAELGAENGEDFLAIDELGFGRQTYSGSSDNTLINFQLQKVRSITVNKVHGNELTIARTLERFHPQIESMEGAAFFYACHHENVPARQIRSVSNYVERRNRENWDIKLAVRNLNRFLIDTLKY